MSGPRARLLACGKGMWNVGAPRVLARRSPTRPLRVSVRPWERVMLFEGGRLLDAMLGDGRCHISVYRPAPRHVAKKMVCVS